MAYFQQTHTHTLTHTYIRLLLFSRNIKKEEERHVEIFKFMCACVFKHYFFLIHNIKFNEK